MSESRSLKDLLVERLAARTDPKLHQHSAPLGYRLRGASTLLDADGNVKATWIKTGVDHGDPGLLLDCFREIAEEHVRPAGPLPEPTADSSPDLLAVLPYGDPHIGMLSWHLETGEDFDLKIARHVMTEAARKLVGLMPACDEGLVISVGDTFHADNNDSRTRSGNPLDVDSRLQKVVRVGMATFVDVVDIMLLKHKRVRVVVVSGNHDPLVSSHFAMMLELYYRNEPRVIVDTSPAAHRYHHFGKCLFGVTHGDTVKLGELGDLMSADVPELWGQTKHRHWYTGHVHHTQVKELRGCTAESLRTLAAKDAWHAASGYRSARGMFGDVWHREHGHRCRHLVGVEELGKS